MTRGFIIIKRGKKIKVAYRLHSDAYPCGAKGSYCEIVTSAFKSGDFAKSVAEALSDEIRRGHGGAEIEPNLTRDWYVMTSKNKDDFFNDYAYEFDETKQVLTIFFFGKKILSFTKEQIPYMDYLFGMDDSAYYRIDRGLSYDFDALDFSADGDKEFMRLMTSDVTVEEIEQKVSATLKSARVQIHDGRVIDVRPQNFRKYVSLLDDDGKATYDFQFVVDYTDFMPKNRRYALLIQTPTCRRHIGTPCGSARGVLKQLKSLLSGDRFVDSLEKTAEIFKKAETLQNAFHAFRKLDKGLQKAGIAECLDSAWKVARTASDAPCVGGGTERSLLTDIVDGMVNYKHCHIDDVA